MKEIGTNNIAVIVTVLLHVSAMFWGILLRVNICWTCNSICAVLTTRSDIFILVAKSLKPVAKI
jgi:hypothetical protein